MSQTWFELARDARSSWKVAMWLGSLFAVQDTSTSLVLMGVALSVMPGA